MPQSFQFTRKLEENQQQSGIINGTCLAFDQDPVLFIATRFQNTPTIERAHHTTPRFNHPSELKVILEGSEDEVSGYLLGVMSLSFGIFGFFFFWTLSLIVLRCLGHGRVGLFAGYRVAPTPPSPPSTFPSANQALVKNEESKKQAPAEKKDEREASKNDKIADSSSVLEHDENQIAGQQHHYIGGDESGSDRDEDIPDVCNEALLGEWYGETERSNRVLVRIRVAVLVFGFIIVICAVLMVSFGVDSLLDSLWEVRKGLSKSESLALEAVELIDEFLRRQKHASSGVRRFSDSLNQFCPTVRNELCSALWDSSSCNFEDVPFAAAVQEVIETSRRSFYLDLFDLRKDLLETAEILNKYESSVSGFNWAFWIAASYAIALAVLTLLIMYSCVLAWQRKASRIRAFVGRWFIVPLYALFLFFSWLFSMIFIIGSTMSADLCIDSPDDRILAFLEKNRDMFSSTIYQFARFYVGGCQAEDYPYNLSSTIDSILKILSVFHDLAGQLESVQSDVFFAECGTNGTVLADLGSSAETTLCGAADTLVSIEEFFGCSNWHPLYTTVVYNAVCYEGNRGFSWIASMQLAIVVFAMLMLTFRVAFAEEEIQVEGGEDVDECRRMVAGDEPGTTPDMVNDERRIVLEETYA